MRRTQRCVLYKNWKNSFNDIARTVNDDVSMGSLIATIFIQQNLINKYFVTNQMRSKLGKKSCCVQFHALFTLSFNVAFGIVEL